MAPLDHNCVHDHLTKTAPTAQTSQPYAVPLSPHSVQGSHGRSLQFADGVHDEQRQPIRVHVDTSRVDEDPNNSCFSRWDTHVNPFGKRIDCGWSDIITDEKRKLLKTQLIPKAVGFVQSLLNVHRVQGRLRLSSITCGYEAGVQVPAWMRQDGLDDADFVVFVTMRPIESPDTVAYSGHCEVDQTGRPIAAHFNWYPLRASKTPQDEPQAPFFTTFSFCSLLLNHSSLLTTPC